MNQKDRLILQKIKQYCNDVEKLIARFGDGYKIYESDFAYQYACSMCIIQIGELTAQLSEEIKATYQDVPWQQIKSMRNLFAHDYARVDHEIVWETLKDNIPELEKKCGDILDSRKEEYHG